MDLESAKQLIEQYGYLAIFLSTVIEGEFVVLAAAAIAATGLLQAHWVIAAAALGAWVGHMLLFAIGRWKGMQLIESVPSLRRHYPKANLVMDKYANWSVFIFQYLYGLRLVSAMLFGCSTITLGRFMALQVINCIVWAMLAYFAGHIIGMLAARIFEMVGIYGLLLSVAAVAFVLLVLYQRFAHQWSRGGGRAAQCHRGTAFHAGTVGLPYRAGPAHRQALVADPVEAARLCRRRAGQPAGGASVTDGT